MSPNIRTTTELDELKWHILNTATERVLDSVELCCQIIASFAVDKDTYPPIRIIYTNALDEIVLVSRFLNSQSHQEI